MKKQNTKPSRGKSVNIPDMEMELLNLKAQHVFDDNQLQDDAVSHNKDSEGLNDGPLSLEQKKMCRVLWSQYMKAVDFLVNSWAVKPYRILSEGGAVPPVSAGQTENI
jgi:hypothetical protein